MAKILVIDDDDKMLKLFQEILSNEGFNVLTANNGADGLRLAAAEIPDLIILDVMMPEKDGGEVACDLSKDAKTKNIPVIFLTSLVTEEEAGKDGKEISGRLYMSKTTSKKEFIKKIKEVLAKF